MGKKSRQKSIRQQAGTAARGKRGGFHSDTSPRNAIGKEDLVICLFLAVITIIPYAQVLGHQFLNFDDDLYLINNPVFMNGLTSGNMYWAFSTFYASNWHPLTWFSWWLDLELFGLDPGYFHLTNLLLHGANAVLLFLLLRKLTGTVWRSAMVAALLALHPLHVESVAWIAERKDVLSTFFLLLTIWVYAWYSGRPGIKRMAVVALILCLGLMAKPMLVTAPFLLLLLDYWPLRRLSWQPSDGTQSLIKEGWRLVREKIPLFMIVAGSSVITYRAQQTGGALTSLDVVPFTTRMANSLVAYVAYLGKMLVPADLSVFYPYDRTIPAWQPVTAAIFLLTATFLVVRYSRRLPCLVTGWFWYLGALVPVIGLVQVGGQAMADRYTYIPLIGIYILVAWGIHHISGRRPAWNRPEQVLAIATLVLLASLTWSQVRIWKNSLALFSHAVAIDPENGLAHHNLGFALQQQGQVDQAITHFSAATSFSPQYFEAHYNLGKALAERGDRPAALGSFRKSLSIKPDYAEAHYSLAVTLWHLDNQEEAAEHFAQSLDYGLKPEYAAQAHNFLGIFAARKGSLDDGLRHFSESARLVPGADAFNNIGLVLLQLNRTAEAIRNFQRALEINPGFQQAETNLATARQKNVYREDAQNSENY